MAGILCRFMHSLFVRATMHEYMKTPIAHLSRKVLLLSSAVAFMALLPSCLPPPLPYRARVSVRGPGYYDSLPSDYRGDYYQHGTRYYYGGRHESGRQRRPLGAGISQGGRSATVSTPAVRSRLALTAGLMLLVATGTGAAAASPARPVVQPTQEQAALLEPQKAFSKPDLRSPPVGLVTRIASAARMPSSISPASSRPERLAHTPA